ncbi:CYFA0S03e03004g1_1 [Cyberlindnera fabianii]|uniref:Leucine carboxyl methyltransferase 1 n=1 Tax=Cyberlindnera fabianii TaxID=36022 RepID=A0A061AQH5_CYBFA|nr:Leucine carboxyl methyltransferase 1 [Cyberlindnera fabianii]CDR39409.1 CYFA0S03e03004g1_1 [Cyberlindnera fabianii]
MANPADKTIRTTDYDALSCRFNAIRKNYLPDNYTTSMLSGLERLLKYESKLSHKRTFNAIVKSNKLPIINRGTYIRTRALDIVIEEFLRRFDGKCRVMNLGAGSDMRGFWLLEKYKDVEYVEIDFKETVRMKKGVVLTDEKLAGIVGAAYVKGDTQEWWDGLSGGLKTERYELVELDLRNVQALNSYLKEFDEAVPTLVLSECMLCYTESSVANEIIKTLKERLPQAALAIYDPIGGEGNFGNVMVENLKMRNLQMPSLLEYNTLEKYQKRLKDLGIPTVKGANMYFITNSWIDIDEQRRISKLEFLDEIEELKLLLEHYCLVLGYWGFDWELKLKFSL